MTAQRSLVLVTVDCFRADHAGWLGYDRPTTPFLDTIAARSFVFSNAIVGGAPTYYSLPAILASRHPLALGRDVIGLAPEEVTLASVLRECGHATAAFVASNPYLSTNFGYDSGFDVFEDFSMTEPRKDDPSAKAEGERERLRGSFNRMIRGLSYGVGQGELYEDLYFDYCQRQTAGPESFDKSRRFPAADRIVDEACDWLANNQGRPFFLWLHFMDPHAPYYPNSASLIEMGSGDIDAARARYLNAYWNRCDLSLERLKPRRREIVALYDAGIRWVDEQLKRLCGFLSQERIDGNYVLALTADHGEEFLEHGNRYHAPAAWEELIRVPLLINIPGEVSGRVDAPFSLLNLAPTLLNSIGAPVPREFRGASIWRRLQGESAMRPVPESSSHAVLECVAGCTNPFRAENRQGSRVVCVREDRYKLVIDFSSGQDALFDLKIDPAEIAPLVTNQSADVRIRMLKKAREHIVGSQNLHDNEARLAARLRDLRQSAAPLEELTPV